MSKRLSALIARANDIIGDATPIPADCGQLCGAACCQGEEAGMLLFPGEMVRLSEVPGFRMFRMDYMDGKAWLLTCDGTCDRELRPLSCRIFPLVPHIGESGVVTAVPDPRARRLCPLATGEFLDRQFHRRVAKALALLAEDPKMLDFMERLSRECQELQRFF